MSAKNIWNTADNSNSYGSSTRIDLCHRDTMLQNRTPKTAQ